MKRFLLIFLMLGTVFAVQSKEIDNIFGIENVVFEETGANTEYENDDDDDDESDVDNPETDSLAINNSADSTQMVHTQWFDENSYEGVYNHVWTNFDVNPYNINLYKMKDTIKIDMSGYTHPFLGRITSNFGMRTYRWHYGTDVKLLIGDTIRSAFDGLVRISKWGTGYGYYVLVRHDNGLETIYGHCSQLLVEPGTYVRSGDPIALGGNTGRSTGSHLHYEIRYVGNAINPVDVVDFETGLVKDSVLVICDKTFKYKGVNLSYYTIKKGDNLSSIAKRRGTTVSKLCKLNNITPKTVLKIGRKIRVS